MGYDFNGQTTQVTNKQITSVVARLQNSLFGQMGTSYFNRNNIQYTTYNNITDIQKLPIDFDYICKILDTKDKKKQLYLSQEVPFPFNVNMLVIKMDSDM
jgi:hypothetical protein